MGEKVSPADAALYRKVSDVLLHEWDPCGIRDFPEAHDEYYGYLPHVFRLVRDGASAEAICDRLYQIEVDLLGRTAGRSRADQVAKRLSELPDGLSESALLSEPALDVDRNRPEEDDAWEHLQ